MPLLHLPKVWQFSWHELVNSLLATLALGLALGSALASSFAAREGNVAVAVALAVFSLVLALVIALTVVPRLFRRARAEWLWLPFTVTRDGWIYLFAVLVVAAAAFNTGNNLIFIVLSAALALGIVSECLSGFNLRRLDCAVDLPECVAAGQRFVSVLTLRNGRRLLPAFSCRIQVAIRSSIRETAASSDQAPSQSGMRVYFPFLKGGCLRRHTVPLWLPHRGLYILDHLEINTHFPFGFVRKTKKAAAECHVIVLPEIEALAESFEALPLLSGTLESFRKGWGTDLHSLRDYSTRDNARFLDWKASARTGRLVMREFLKEDDRKCCFVFDNAFPGFGTSDRLAFERAVKACANLLRHFRETGSETRLVTPQGSTPYSKSEEGLTESLKLLAVIQPDEDAANALPVLAAGSSFKIVFTASRRGEVPATVWSDSHVVFIREWSA